MGLALLAVGILLGYALSEVLPLGWVIFIAVVLLIVAVFYKPPSRDTS
jgi:hypothetical protein